MVFLSHPRIEFEVLSWSKNEYFRLTVVELEICVLYEGKEASNRERLIERGRRTTTKIQCIFSPRIIATRNEKYNGKLEV